MNFEVIRLKSFPNAKATIYSVIMETDAGSATTLFERFIEENSGSYRQEMKDIMSRLQTIAQKTGSSDHFFKDWEGRPGDGVCALYDTPARKLRLYCIRFGRTILIVGGGGPKPKGIRTLQESEKLAEENSRMRMISQRIATRIREGDLAWTSDELELTGNFYFNEYD